MSRWQTGPAGKMRMADNKLGFECVPEGTNNVRVLGSLVFDKRKELGPKALLDLTDVTEFQGLARDLIAALYEHASPSRIASDLSLGAYHTVIRELLDYCSLRAVPNEFRMLDISYDFLLEYRAHLQVSSVGFKSEYRRRRFGNILRLLEAGEAAGLARSEFSPPRNFADVGDSDTTQPYTAGEALDFESACRTHIRELLERLEKGNELLATGKDPRGRRDIRDPVTGRLVKQRAADRPWNQLPNLLWYVVNVMDGRYLKRKELLNGHSSFNNVVMGCDESPYRKGDVYSHLYPLTWDLIPFIILLAKQTGRNETSILGLRRDCLQEISGRHILWYEKERGSARRYKKVIDNEGPFSPVALIKTLQLVTEPLVRHALPDEQEYLFLGLTIEGHGREPMKSLDPSYIMYQMNQDGGWCDQRELTDEHGEPLRVSFRRWRVFYLTNRYKKTGQLSKISRDAGHTLGTTTVDYVANDATRHVHEQAVRNAQQEAKALARPKVITDEAPQAAATVLGTDGATAQRILRGDQDVLFASCKDFYNRPGGQPNTPCDKPWGCFVCSNAIITRQVLPRVLALRDFIQQTRSELSNEDWHAKFGQVWHVITHDVLPRFPGEAIAEAERLAQDQVFYIPLAMRT